jgi:hypothetical protein
MRFGEGKMALETTIHSTKIEIACHPERAPVIEGRAY